MSEEKAAHWQMIIAMPTYVYRSKSFTILHKANKRWRPCCLYTILNLYCKQQVHH